MHLALPLCRNDDCFASWRRPCLLLSSAHSCAVHPPCPPAEPPDPPAQALDLGAAVSAPGPAEEPVGLGPALPRCLVSSGRECIGPLRAYGSEAPGWQEGSPPPPLGGCGGGGRTSKSKKKQCWIRFGGFWSPRDSSASFPCSRCSFKGSQASCKAAPGPLPFQHCAGGQGWGRCGKSLRIPGQSCEGPAASRALGREVCVCVGGGETGRHPWEPEMEQGRATTCHGLRILFLHIS